MLPQASNPLPLPPLLGSCFAVTHLRSVSFPGLHFMCSHVLPLVQDAEQLPAKSFRRHQAIFGAFSEALQGRGLNVSVTCR